MVRPPVMTLRFKSLTPFVLTSLVAFSGALGCSEIEARRTIQDGDEFYEDGEYSEAIETYENALDKSNIDVAHHNLAIAAYKAFQPGVETEANLEYSAKAAKHFQAYLETHPDDQEIIDLLTTLWLDSEQYDEAEAHWLKQLDAKPGDPVILKRLRTINQQAGQFDKALQWDYKRVEVAKDNDAKFKVYLDIAQLQYSRLTKASLVDDHRIKVADSGIAALQKALAAKPAANNVYALMATLYQFRSLSHYTTWGQTIDAASQSIYQVKHSEAQKAAKQAALETPTPKEEAK